MEYEFRRLEKLGWDLPPRLESGIYSTHLVDEDLISFPPQSYEGESAYTESEGYWASERAHRIADLLLENNVDVLWEIGAGSGNVSKHLRDKKIDVITIEPLHAGAKILNHYGFPTFLSTFEMLKLPSDSIRAVGAFDVLEHLEDPNVLLREIHRVLNHNGIFICSVPAYQWLFSHFDLEIGHFRRYSRKTLRRKLACAGFYETQIYSLFGYLVFPAFCLRRIPKLLGRRRDYTRIKISIDRHGNYLSKFQFVFKFLGKLERKFNLPIGLSIIAIGKKSSKTNS